MNRSSRRTARSNRAVAQLTKQTNAMSLRNSRRRRRRRNGGGGRNNLMPGGVLLNDVEVLPVPDKEKLFVCSFCPGKTGLVRLDHEATKFKRWSLIRVIITYQPTASLSDKGAITYGILPGPQDKTVTLEKIVQLRPFQKHALWKSSSITVSASIMVQQHMYTSGTNEDSVGFCLYINTSDNTLGLFRIHYQIALNYPEP